MHAPMLAEMAPVFAGVPIAAVLRISIPGDTITCAAQLRAGFGTPRRRGP